jgi:hypothetical protein
VCFGREGFTQTPCMTSNRGGQGDCLLLRKPEGHVSMSRIVLSSNEDVGETHGLDIFESAEALGGKHMFSCRVFW